MDILYNKYMNIWECFTKYRKCDILEEKYTLEQFKKKIEQEQHISHIAYSPTKEIFNYIFFFTDESYIIKTADSFETMMINLINKKNKSNMEIFKKYLDSRKIQNSKILTYAKSNLNVVLITKKELSTYIRKKIIDINSKLIATKSTTQYHNYLHKHFLLNITKGAMCSPHSILTKDEMLKLCSRELMIHPLSLPSILINDPQVIWIGAEIGEIIKIEANSEMAGKAIRYRIVTPVGGKVITEDNQNADFESDIEDVESDGYDSNYDSQNEEPNDAVVVDKETEIVSDTEYSDDDDDDY